MRNKEIRIIIQNGLLCVHSKLASLICIKGLMQLRHDIIKIRIAVFAIIFGSIRYNCTCEEIFRITGRCSCKRAYIYIKFSILCIRRMVCCIVDIDLNSDVL